MKKQLFLHPLTHDTLPCRGVPGRGSPQGSIARTNNTVALPAPAIAQDPVRQPSGALAPARAEASARAREGTVQPAPGQGLRPRAATPSIGHATGGRAARRAGPAAVSAWHGGCIFRSRAWCVQRPPGRSMRRANEPHAAPGPEPLGSTQLPNHGHDTGHDAPAPSQPQRSRGRISGAPRPAGRTCPAGPALHARSPPGVQRGLAHACGRQRPGPDCGQNRAPAPCHHDAPQSCRRDAPPIAGRMGRERTGAVALVAPPGSLPRRPAVAGEAAQPAAGPIVSSFTPMGARHPVRAPCVGPPWPATLGRSTGAARWSGGDRRVRPFPANLRYGR
jgi:hypothetical protein